MLKYILVIISLVHGLIHLMGFARAFDFGDMKQLTLPVSKQAGLVWLAAAILFIAATAMYLLKKEYWWMAALPAVLISQVVIVMSWKDARFGTIPNLLILAAALLSWGNSRFENSFRKDVTECLDKSRVSAADLLTESDLLHLPPPVQRYLKYAGVVNQPKVKNVRILFEGQMRDKGKNYFSFQSEQYNFFDDPARLFFMKANMFGITVPGYHHYIREHAVMDIRFAGIFSLVKKDGDLMNKTETVTLFNDMCLLAPATLIDKRIKWQQTGPHSVTAVFTNRAISISATLHFNERGQLINFISTDRASVSDMKNYPWSTPVHSYDSINGFHLMSAGDAVWHYPDGDFVYGKFRLKNLAYNVTR